MDSFTDIPTSGWADRTLPRGVMPYIRLARLDRPIGWWLLLLPCWWGLAITPPGHATLILFALFFIGAITMRGAGCTLNDIIDRKIDAEVERTRRRPLPAGEVSLTRAIAFMICLSMIGALVLFSLNWLTVGLGLAILLIVCSYPFMKRFTSWPQFFLGINFNWGTVMAYAAATGTIRPATIILYVGGIAWTLGYDTIYAHQDKRDDVAAGVKSTALRFGNKSREWVGGFFLMTILCTALALALIDAGSAAYLFLTLAAAHFLWQLVDWTPDDPADCLAKFKSNREAGWLLLAACLASHL